VSGGSYYYPYRFWMLWFDRALTNELFVLLAWKKRVAVRVTLTYIVVGNIRLKISYHLIDNLESH
jgi:hypothetical protein